MTRDAEAAAADDRDMVVIGLDERVRAAWGSFESFPVRIHAGDHLTVTLTTPFMNYRKGVIEHLLMRAPLADVPWTDAAVVSVFPERLDAADITAIRVVRDGVEIAPVANRLRPMRFTNGRGESTDIGAGEVHFPSEAFRPGATVLVEAVPRTGPPYVLRLTDDQLRELK